MPIAEPESPAEMEDLKKRPELMELLLHQRSEQGHRWALIHNLLYQGKTEEAKRVAAMPDQQGHIDVHQAAVDNPDDEWCGCEHRATALQPLKHQVIGKSWSEKHGGIVTHYRCQYCGHRNATPAPPDDGHDKIGMLKKQQEARYRPGQMPAVSDVEVVERLGRHPDE
jgi:hypothetical protein